MTDRTKIVNDVYAAAGAQVLPPSSFGVHFVLDMLDKAGYEVRSKKSALEANTDTPRPGRKSAMKFDPARVPVGFTSTGEKSEKGLPLATMTVDLRPFGAWLLREMAEGRNEFIISGNLRRLADKIAAGSTSGGVQGSTAAPDGVASPAASLQAEIEEVVEWLRASLRKSPDDFFYRSAEVIERLARELKEARAAIVYLDEWKFPYRMSSTHAPAVEAAYKEAADGK